MVNETRRGRHHAEEGAGGLDPRKVIAALLAAAVVVFGGVAMAVSGVFGGSNDDKKPDVANGQYANSSGSTKASAPSASPSNSAAESAKANCVAEVAADKGVADALKPVAEHWRIHTESLTEYEAGQISLKTAENNWATTKKAGKGDLTAYDAALKQYDAKKGSCAKAAASGALTGSAKTQCVTRADKTASLVSAGKPVADEWRAHVKNMANKAHEDSVGYDKTWRGQVKAAPPKITAYDKAAEEYDKAPACSA